MKLRNSLVLFGAFFFLSLQAIKADTIPTIEANLSKLSFDGLTLYSVTGDAAVSLIDNDGKFIHRWAVDATRARLLPNCNLLVVHGTDWGKRNEPWKSLRNTVREYAWDSSVVWEYTADTIAHHDVNRLENGNTIFPLKKVIKHKLPSLDDPSEMVVRRVRSDNIVEITPSGEVAWNWLLHEHLDVEKCGARKCNTPLADERWIKIPRDWSHVNTTSVIPPNKWHESGDARFAPGNVMILPRNFWEFLVVDRKSQKVVWQYSGDFRGGVVAPHEAHMIPEGLPGAGNILVFDNGGRERKYTMILEINPVNKEIEWFYEDGANFYVPAKGAVQRLSNGNTLISGGPTGRIFEVTKDKQIVWDLRAGKSVNRAKKYGRDYCPKLR